MSRKTSFAVLVVLLWPTGAAAYIDPGSGLLLVQGLISAVIGAIFVARRTLLDLFHRAALALGARKAEPRASDSQDDAAPR